MSHRKAHAAYFLSLHICFLMHFELTAIVSISAHSKLEKFDHVLEEFLAVSCFWEHALPAHSLAEGLRAKFKISELKAFISTISLSLCLLSWCSRLLAKAV